MFNTYIGKCIKVSELINRNSNVYRIINAKIIQSPLFPMVMFELQSLYDDEQFWVSTSKLSDYVYAKQENIEKNIN